MRKESVVSLCRVCYTPQARLPCSVRKRNVKTITSNLYASYLVTTIINRGKRMLGSVYTKIQRQRCDDTCDKGLALIEKNGVAPRWLATPFCSISIFCRKRHRSVDSALMLTLSVNGPLWR